jgi:uncharacterized protein (TIGR03435 family)
MKILALLLAMVAPLPAQEFEVASIRPAKQDGNHHDSDIYQGRWVTHNLTLKRLIAMAWDVDDSVVAGGPSWIDSDGYDINAKIPADYVQAPSDQFLHMIQRLLADRFRLTIHREPRQISGYALVPAKTGSKMANARPSGSGSDFSANGMHLKATSVTMEAFAKRLSRNRDIGRIVVDKTGFTGRFDFELDWAPALQDSSEHPSIFTAIQEQLGLKLESAKVQIQTVVVDRVEKPSEN